MAECGFFAALRMTGKQVPLRAMRTLPRLVLSLRMTGERAALKAK